MRLWERFKAGSKGAQMRIHDELKNPRSKTMKIFFDSKFTGLHQKTTLISIGFITELDITFYAEFVDYDKNQINEWLSANVLGNLLLEERSVPPNIMSDGGATMCSDSRKIAYWLREWLQSFNSPIEIWSDCLAYNWVLFCELFGGEVNIPGCVHYIPFDICTLMQIKGVDPNINREEFVGLKSETKHNALWDAKVIKSCYEKSVGM